MQACPVNDGISYLLKSKCKQKVSKIDLHWLFNQHIAHIFDFDSFLTTREINSKVKNFFTLLPCNPCSCTRTVEA